MEDKYMRPVVAGGVIGGVVAALMIMGVQLPTAVAREEPFRTAMSTANELFPLPIDTSNLVRIGDQEWSGTADPGVSLTPISSAIITKIGFGRRELVQVSTTSTGIYSSDSMMSPYVRYPGVHVTHVAPAAEGNDDTGSLAFWTPRLGWVPANAVTIF